MSAGIRDHITRVTLRQVRIFRIAVEGELKHSRPGDTKLVAQCAHVGRDHSQVLGKKWKGAQLLLYCAEKLGARAWHPMSNFGGGRSSRHVPRGGESTKVIQPNRVDVREQGAHPIDAPAKAGSPMGLPVVHRVAPKLSIGAEVVWRYAGYEKWVEVIIEQEQLGVGPNIARIPRNKKGQIANQADALGTRAFPEPFALPEQQELREAELLDSVRQFTAGPS